MDKILLNIKDLKEYTGWGESKIREILNRPSNGFTIRVGNRLYVNKKLFDEYLLKCAKYDIKI